MHRRKSLFIVIAMVAALAVLAPSTAAASETSRHSRDLHITKECSAYTHLAGGFCTITSSNLPAIPIGSKVIYEQSLVGTVLETDVTLDPPGPGDVAFGHVHLDLVTKVGVATFTGGTGKFAGFDASVAVTPNPGVAFGWKWEGTYTFSRDNFYLDKTCAPDLSPIGYHCTVQHSGFRMFPAGTEVHYAATSNPNVVRATITVRRGQNDRSVRLEQRRQRGVHVQARDREAGPLPSQGRRDRQCRRLRLVLGREIQLRQRPPRSSRSLIPGSGHHRLTNRP